MTLLAQNLTTRVMYGRFKYACTHIRSTDMFSLAFAFWRYIASHLHFLAKTFHGTAAAVRDVQRPGVNSMHAG